MQPRVRMTGSLAVLVLLARPDPAAGQGAATVPATTTTLWTAGEGFPCYRQPVVIAAEPSGKRLLAFVEGRFSSPCAPAAGQPDTNMYEPHEAGGLNTRTSDDGGTTWGPSRIIFGNATKAGPNMDYFSVVRDDHTHTLMLFVQGHWGAVGMFKSTDQGHSWGSPQPLQAPAGVKAPTVGHGIQLRSSRLLVPAVCNASCMLYSDDHGTSWQLGGFGVKGSRESVAAEVACPSLARDDDNASVPRTTDTSCVYINARNLNKPAGSSDDVHTRLASRSTDGGVSWTPMKPVAGMRTPVTPHWTGIVASVSAVVDGRLVYAGASAPTARATLALTVSEDGGVSWGAQKVLWAGPAGYADTVAINASTVGVLYEAGDQSFADRIQFSTVSLGQL